MDRISNHPHSNIANIKSYCRNRRQSIALNPQQQTIQETIAAKTLEFQNQVQRLQLKLKQVKFHVKQTKNRLNSLHRYLD